MEVDIMITTALQNAVLVTEQVGERTVLMRERMINKTPYSGYTVKVAGDVAPCWIGKYGIVIKWVPNCWYLVKIIESGTELMFRGDEIEVAWGCNEVEEN